MKVRLKNQLKENKQVLEEFNSTDKQEILQNGDLFTISYELEMESSDTIDDEGNILSDSDPEQELRDYLDGLSPRRQVDFFNFEDSLNESAREADADSLYYEEVVSNDLDLNKSLAAVLAVIVRNKTKRGITIDEEGREEETPVVLKESDLETFVLASYLSSERGEKYNEMLVDKSNNPIQYAKILDIASEMGIYRQADFNFTGFREQTIGQILGFKGVEWDITFIPENLEYSPVEFFRRIVNPPEDFFQDEIHVLTTICLRIFGRYETLGSVENSEYRASREESLKYFSEFKEATKILAKKASLLIESIYESKVDSFDYSDYDIDLEPYLGDWPSNNDKTGDNALDSYLPNFWSRYGNQMDVGTDGSLPSQHNLEIAMKTYLQGVPAAMEYLDIFFEDFENQSNFSFSKKTGLHTNVSLDKEDKYFNLLKALMFLGEKERDNKAPFVFKGTETRYGQRWTGLVKEKVFTHLREQMHSNNAFFHQVKDAYENNNLEGLESLINRRIDAFKDTLNSKYHGFNMRYTQTRGYIEFRYPGHNITKDALKNLTLYYCHVVKTALDPEYKKKEYMQKLVGFTQELLSAGKVNSDLERLKIIDKYIESHIADRTLSDERAKNFEHTVSMVILGKLNVNAAQMKKYHLLRTNYEGIVEKIIAADPSIKTTINRIITGLPIIIKKCLSQYFNNNTMYEDFPLFCSLLFQIPRTSDVQLSVKENDSTRQVYINIMDTLRDSALKHLFSESDSTDIPLSESKKRIVKVIKK